MNRQELAAKMDELLGGDSIIGQLEGLFTQMEWAEDEIEKARKRHPGQADTIYHSFKLLTPTHELMGTEFVYRSHCRELLNRVAAGHDTRPGTAAEVCLMCCDTSALAPLNSAGAGLYGRMWTAAGFPGDQFSARQLHHEALDASLIDGAEGEARRKLAVADRKTGDVDCGGMHHGEHVTCAYATPAQPAEPVQLALIA
jgi:hypothetical protein